MNGGPNAATAAAGLARALLDAVAVPAWIQRDGHVWRANLALQRLSGRPRDTLQTLPCGELVVPADRARLTETAAQCLHQTAELPAMSMGLLAHDGSVRPVELSLRRIGLDGDAAVLVTCTDHSDRLHVQESLQAMSGLLGQIVDGAPVASFVIDAQHRVTHWNTACEALTGHRRHSMLGSTEAWRAFYNERRPLLADLIVDGVQAVEQGVVHGSPVRPSALINGACEAEEFFPNFGPDGCWLYFTAAPLLDAEGRVIGAIETLQDVSRRHHAEDELKRHRHALEQLVSERTAALANTARDLAAFIDNAPVGVICTVQGQVTRANRKFSEMFGLGEASAVGRSTLDFYLNADDRTALNAVAEPLLLHGLAVHHELWMRHASGKPIWVQVNAHVADHQNTDAGTWWMFQDRSAMRAAGEELRARLGELETTNRQLEEAQNQLLQADKMASIGQLAAGVAHEINNPVGFVSSNLNTLRQYIDELLSLVNAYAGAHQAPASAEAAALLARVQAQVEIDYLTEDLPQLLDESADGLSRVKKIVQDLKDFSRVDQADWQDADLNAGLESTLNVVRHEVKYKADIVKQLAPLPLVRCLPGQLNQVFLNLIVNASHAIQTHGVITLSSGVHGAWVWVAVADTGCGMGEEVRRRVFEPFFTTKDVGKGTGLGLSLSFSIAQRHGGVIQVRSAPQQGSVFRVCVPVAGPAAEGAVAADLGELPPWP